MLDLSQARLQREDGVLKHPLVERRISKKNPVVLDEKSLARCGRIWARTSQSGKDPLVTRARRETQAGAA